MFPRPVRAHAKFMGGRVCRFPRDNLFLCMAVGPGDCGTLRFAVSHAHNNDFFNNKTKVWPRGSRNCTPDKNNRGSQLAELRYRLGLVLGVQHEVPDSDASYLGGMMGG